MDMYGYVWICMYMYGYVWICMDINGYVWICMDMLVFIHVIRCIDLDLVPIVDLLLDTCPTLL